MSDSLMNDYKWYVHETGEPQECECCRAHVPVSSFRLDRPRHEESQFLCGLCASTPVGRAQQYSEQYSYESRVVMQTINYSTNQILRAMGVFGTRK